MGKNYNQVVATAYGSYSFAHTVRSRKFQVKWEETDETNGIISFFSCFPFAESVNV